jgi:VWFA-related protein
MPLRRLGLALLLGAAACVIGSAQQVSPPPRFRTDVDLLRLDVSVLDQHRRAVRGLTATDFIVLEDDQPRPIAAFTAIDLPDERTQPEGWPREVAADIVTNQLDAQRLVVIVMDDGMTEHDPATTTTAKRIAREVIDRLAPRDLAAVVFTFQGRSQNFTTDRRQLAAAIDSYSPKSSGPTPAFSAVSPSEVFGPPLGCALPGRPNCLMRTLKDVARVLEGTPVGRKSVVLISGGVPDKLEEMEVIDDLRETLRSLQVANVNVYPFDPTGLTADGIIGPRIDSLRVLADHTGGRTTVATNAPWEQVPQVFTENSSYYLLGIEPAHQARDNRFHRLTVKVRRPDVEVRTRTGYYAPPPERRRSGGRSTPETGLDKAFGAALPSGSLPLTVTAAPFASTGRKDAAVAVTIAVRRPVSDTVSEETIEVRAAAFDEHYTQRASQRQAVHLTLRPSAIGERRAEVPSRLSVPPGRYEIRVAAEAPTGAGSVFLQVEVPDFRKSRLSLSGLVLGQPRTGGPDTLADLVPVRPTTLRVFTRSTPMTAFLRVYQGGKDAPVPVRVRARILDVAGRIVFEDSRALDATLFTPNRAADYNLTLPLAGLGPGQHLLVLDVEGAKATERRDVRFTVVDQ